MCTLKSSLKEEGRQKQGQVTDLQGMEDEYKMRGETKNMKKKKCDEHRGIVNHFRRLKMAKKNERKGLQSSRKP